MPSPIDKSQLASLECRLLSVRERAEILEAMQWAKGFDWKQIERIANFMEVFVAKKDQLIFQEGDKADFMCLIAKGQVGVFKEDSRKDQRRITSLGVATSSARCHSSTANPARPASTPKATP
ncbi:MAG: cyclic nucleotide-binding domain-containing protein [bacterium]